MSGSADGLHEDRAKLPEDVLDRHRAIASLMEELEAVDWYDQRVAATRDPELRALLAHNRDEEKEHAVMTLEWLRRRDPRLDRELRTYLFTDGDILAVEDSATSGGPDPDPVPDPVPDPAGGSLGIGSLKEHA